MVFTVVLSLFQPNVPIEWDQYWSPKIFIENAVGDPKVTQSRMLEHNINGEAWVTDRRRVKGCFIEQLELWEFPFDVQVGSERENEKLLKRTRKSAKFYLAISFQNS